MKTEQVYQELKAILELHEIKGGTITEKKIRKSVEQHPWSRDLPEETQKSLVNELWNDFV